MPPPLTHVGVEAAVSCQSNLLLQVGGHHALRIHAHTHIGAPVGPRRGHRTAIRILIEEDGVSIKHGQALGEGVCGPDSDAHAEGVLVALECCRGGV